MDVRQPVTMGGGHGKPVNRIKENRPARLSALPESASRWIWGCDLGICRGARRDPHRRPTPTAVPEVFRLPDTL